MDANCLAEPDFIIFVAILPLTSILRSVNNISRRGQLGSKNRQQQLNAAGTQTQCCRIEPLQCAPALSFKRPNTAQVSLHPLEKDVMKLLQTPMEF